MAHRSARATTGPPDGPAPHPLNDVFWVEGEIAAENRLRADADADVVVIGGGLTGLSTALFIKSRHPGRNVLLLESEVCGFGASGRNAGMALGQAGVDPEMIERRLGTAKARRTLALLGRGLEILEQLALRHDYGAAVERTGSLALGRNDRHARAHREFLATYGRLGLEAEILDRDAVRREIRSPRYVSGFHVPRTTALVDPWKTVRGLRGAALTAGVRIHEGTPVLEIHPGIEHRIVCAGGTVRAPALVLGTNGYSSHLGYFRNRVAPVHVSCIVTEPLDSRMRNSLGWAARQSLWEEGWLYHFFRLTPDDRVLIGGGWAVYRMNDRLDFPGATAVYQRLEHALREIFPQLAEARITHRWSGPVGFARDFLPSFGVTGRDRNIYYALGYSGHGVAMSHLAGEVLCDLYSGARSDLTDLFLVNRRFRTLLVDPLKWLVITAVRNGYLMLDRLGL